MKIGIIGDPHFANHGVFGRPTPQAGVNSRLWWAREVMDSILTTLDRDIHISKVVVMGDLTHYHGKLTPPVARAVHEVFDHRDTEIVVLTGNHDIDENNQSILTSAFDWDDTTGLVFVDSGVLEDDILYFPYSAREWEDDDEPLVALKETLSFGNPKYIFMHHHFAGAVHSGKDFAPANGLPLEVIPKGAKVICGHYHKRQTLFNEDGEAAVEYVGAPLQHTFGEAGYETGYSVLDTDTGELEFFPVDIAPKFYIVPVDDNTVLSDVPGRHDKDYYRLDIPLGDIPENYKELTSGLSNYKVKRTKSGVVVRSRVEEALPNVDNLGIIDVVAAYTLLNTEEGDRRDHLMEVGKNLLAEVS